MALKRKSMDARLKISGMTKSTIKGRCPLINPQKRKTKRQNERSKITRRKSLRVVTPEASIIPLSLIPECFYQESKLFKGEDIWIPD